MLLILLCGAELKEMGSAVYKELEVPVFVISLHTECAVGLLGAEQGICPIPELSR